ncbi:amidohydrolase family protein [Nocardia aurantiaca]|uniref:Amidohydrolase family protein n=1 Tax=Nocardia aurantiaca TaxID=2675850 RepID=A0A6I3L082_9NOCA|nr:amidohydrolase family protein [Nocardia aurantiaca]MTE14668.1 amidohydrolase family protein [Nocardia aurantiaca]
MVTDVHAHVTVDSAAQLARAKAAGVDRTVLLSTRVHPERARTLDAVRAEFARLTAVIGGADAAPDEVRAAMGEVLRALEAHPGATLGFASLPSLLPDERLGDWFEPYLSRPDIVGIGEITPPPGQAARIEPVLALSADHGGVPILVHGFAPNTLDDLRTYAALAARYPSVPLIVGALGGFHALELVELAAARPNLHIDLSSALQVFAVAAAAREVPEQCLFGSNTPYGDVVAARHTAEAAIADPSVRTLVLEGNFQRILGD